MPSVLQITSHCFHQLPLSPANQIACVQAADRVTGGLEIPPQITGNVSGARTSYTGAQRQPEHRQNLSRSRSTTHIITNSIQGSANHPRHVCCFTTTHAYNIVIQCSINWSEIPYPWGASGYYITTFIPPHENLGAAPNTRSLSPATLSSLRDLSPHRRRSQDVRVG